MQYNSVLKNWLARRKISESVSSDFNIHWGKNKILNECIVIPINNTDGSYSFNKYRRNPLEDSTNKPKYLYDTGSKMQLYAFDKIKDIHNTILITEGEMDCLVCWSFNIPAISSTGGCMGFKEEWAELLKDKEIILCYDNDEAGGKGMVHTLGILPNAKIVFLPDRPGIKDISDYVMNGGDLHSLIKGAKVFNGIDQVIEDRADRIARWQSTFFHDAYIAKHSEPIKEPRKENKNDTTLIERAKNYPINDLIKFSQNKAQCIFHNEKTSSMHYYKKQNVVYCFGCSKRADSIDIYMKIHNCSFLEAIKSLQ